MNWQKPLYSSCLKDAFNYKQFGFKLKGNKLILSCGCQKEELTLNVRLHRQLEGKTKTFLLFVKMVNIMLALSIKQRKSYYLKRIRKPELI